MMEGGEPLRFEEDISWQLDHVAVKCSDEYTKQWIEKIIADNENWGQGTTLGTIIGCKIPRRRPVVVYFRNLDKSLDPVQVQNLLAWQNKDVAVKTWRLWNTRVFLDGTRYTFGALKEEEEALRKLNGILYFDTGTVQFKLANKTVKKDPVTEKEPEIMTISEDDDVEIETSRLSEESFPKLIPRGNLAAAAKTAVAPLTELVSTGETSNLDEDIGLNKLNL